MSVAEAPEPLRPEMARYEGRDRRLWSLVLVAWLSVAVGFVVLVVPSVGSRNYLPQLVLGFAALVTFLNVYIHQQRRTLQQTRTALLQQLVRAEAALAHSFLDPLTGLFNRRYLDYLIVIESKRADRNDGLFALMILDIVGFKSVNDTFGHLEGDRFLQQVAELLKRTFRQTDTLVRYGGDEFVVLMPDTDDDGARRPQERLERAINAWNAERTGSDRTMALRTGVATFRPGDLVEDVLALADRRMYEQRAVRADAVLTDRRA
jgi:diguanylate cyclase (GGDEF)-like protein